MVLWEEIVAVIAMVFEPRIARVYADGVLWVVV